MDNFTKINAADFKVGMRFSSPVFFDDGKNMFLSAGKSAKPYHIAALQRWSIPYVLTKGHEIKEPENTEQSTVEDDIEELEEISSDDDSGSEKLNQNVG